MIPQITELNFPSYLTLHQATVSFTDMGERTISAQVKIDGDVVPSFMGTDGEPLAVTFKGEKFVLPIREPQAAKDNTTRNSIVDLNFQSWPIDQMKRYFFMKMASIDAGTAVPDRYIASISLSLESFVTLLNQVLEYYFGDLIAAELNPNGEFPDTKALITIEHSYIWEVIQKIYETYAVRWDIEYEPINERYVIKIGYPIPEIENHEFEYGFEGGLLKFERQVQDETVNNILLGRGGEKNLPYRYFKKIDPQNPDWTADPDAIPELQNIYFDRLRDANFRRYVQGWRTNPNRDTSWEAVQPYDSERGEADFAYKNGHLDETFDPIEYVKDEESIEKFGERWGYLDDNDDIYPTIQGVIVSNIGRIDEVIAVSPITTDDITTAARAESTSNSLAGVNSMTSYIACGTTVSKTIAGGEFTILTGMTANLTGVQYTSTQPRGRNTQVAVESFSISVYNTEDGTEYPPSGLTAGSYRYEINITVRNGNQTGGGDNVTFGAKDIVLEMAWQEEAWKPTFDIWVKNLFGTTKGVGETDEAYALRVWQPILGDRVGNQASVAFSDGFMSISEDYNFVIASYPEFDQSKTLNGVTSEWRITLRKSDAEFDTTGYYVPNAKTGGSPIAGDHFYLLGIDMPHTLVEAAEEKLNADKTARLLDTATTNPTWVVSLDKIRINRQDTGYLQTLFEMINAGTEISVKDKRFTNNQVLKLIVQSITYTFNEPSDDNPAITPDVEVVLSAKTEAGQSTIEKLQGDIDIVRQSSVQIADLDAIIKRIGSQMFLKKTGESDMSVSPTRFANRVSSNDFSQGGVGGTGWGTYKDEDGRSIFEMDKLVVRDELKVNSLVVNQIAYIGGRRISSAAAMECIQVIEGDHDGEYTDYTCYFDQKQGSVQNLFAVNDIAMSQKFDASGAEVKFYKRLVTAVGENYITLSDDVSYGTGYPAVGDVIVQYGNTTNASRQYVIEEDVIGGGYIKMISGLNAVNAAGSTYFFAGSEIQNGVNSSRLFLGGTNSYVSYSESDGTMKLKGNLVQSPSGSEFPIPCPRGAYSSVTTYYKGDMVTYQGQSWLRVANTAAAGDTPASPNWIIYAERGEAGASPLYRGVYNPSEDYYGDPYRIDIVKYNGLYYRALTTAGVIPGDDDDSVPDALIKWALFGATFESIATGLLVAENAVIENGIITKLRTSASGKRIEAMNNVLQMFDANGKARMVVSGDEVDITAPSKNLALTNIDETVRITDPDEEVEDEYVDVLASFGNILGNSTLTIPQIGFILQTRNPFPESELSVSLVSIALYLQKQENGIWVDVGSSLKDAYAEGPSDDVTTSYAGGEISISSDGVYRLIVRRGVILKMESEPEVGDAHATVATNAAAPATISANEQVVRIGSNGISVALGGDFMMNCAKDENNVRTIEMQGKKTGGEVFGIKMTQSGMFFKFGGIEYSAERDSSGYLKLTQV